jgi:hypothetical protein
MFVAFLLPGTPGYPSEAPVAGAWGQVGADGGWSGYQPATGGLGVTGAGRLMLHWHLAGVRGVVFANGWLYAVTNPGTVREIEPAGGAPGAVVFRHPGLNPGQIAVLGNTLYATLHSAAGDWYLAAYRLGGARRWQVKLPVPASETRISDFVVAGGRVAITTGHRCVHRPCDTYTLGVYRADTGALTWHVTVAGDASGRPPAIVGDRVFQSALAVQGWQTTGYGLVDGHVSWVRASGGAAAGWTGKLFTGGYQSVCAWNRMTGAQLWCHTEHAVDFARPARAAGVLVTGRQQYVDLLGFAANGDERWRTWYGVAGARSRLAADLVSGGGVGYAYVTHTTGAQHDTTSEVIAVRETDGRLLNRVALTAVAPAHARLMLASGHLYLVAGNAIWAFHAHAAGAPAHPPINTA